MNRAPLKKVEGLLKFHKAMARALSVARRCGNLQTTASYLAALKANARVLRSKLLFKNDGTRI